MCFHAPMHQVSRPISAAALDLGARTALLEELAELDAQKARLAHKRGRAILDDAKLRIQRSGRH